MNWSEYVIFLRWLGIRTKYVDGLNVFAVNKYKILFADEQRYCYVEYKDGNIEFSGSDKEIEEKVKKIWKNIVNSMVVE